MGRASRRFSKDLAAEIKRRSKTEDYDMTKKAIEDLGEQAGIPRDQVEREFLKLAGKTWVGHIYTAEAGPRSFFVSHPPSNPLPPWLSVIFWPQWFQERGMWRDP